MYIYLVSIIIGVMFYLVISVLIPTREYLDDVKFISSSNTAFASFGDMAPSYSIPSAVILSRIDEEGMYSL